MMVGGRSPLPLILGLGVLGLGLVMAAALVLPPTGFEGAVRLLPGPAFLAPRPLEATAARERFERFRQQRQALLGEQGEEGQPLGLRGAPRRPVFVRPFGLHPSGLEGIAFSLSSFAALLSASVALSFLAPGTLARLRVPLVRGPRSLARTAVVGILGYLFCGAWALLLAGHFVGLPLAVLLLAGLLLLTLVGLVAVSLSLGVALGRMGGWRPHSPLYDLAAGLLVIFPLSVLPYVGWVTTGLAAVLGFGALLTTRFGTGEGWSLAPLSPQGRVGD
ncbi:MAG: hypothetical protein HYY05_06290 [Chloroflexi bacterium]|nr:hypothetical protein [Chloroflexota bacterium]